MIKFMKKNRALFSCLILLCTFLFGCHGYHSDGEFLYVKRGDTLYSLSKKNDLSMRAVIKENNLKQPYTLKVGQKLKIPQPKIHVVQKGDTLYNVSKRYQMSVHELSKMNELKAPYTIHLGQRLKIRDVDDVLTASSNQKGKTISSDRAKTLAEEKRLNNQKETPLQVKNTPQSRSKGVARSSAKIPYWQRKKKFAWPVKGAVVAKFGLNAQGQQNDGINIKAKQGTYVKAAEEGVIGYASNGLKGYGNLILIRHKSGWLTAYAHNQKLLVKKGQKVKKGQNIALVGATGNVKSPQLHFEIRYKTKVVNPQNYLK